jgi:hypothetical protein
MITTTGHTIVLNRAFKETPDYTAPTIFSVGDGATDPTKSDTELESPVIISATEYKDISTGYPAIDETKLEVSFRMFLNTLEANDEDLTEVGIFNDDTPKKIYSRDTFKELNKTNSVEVSILKKDRIVEVVE